MAAQCGRGALLIVDGVSGGVGKSLPLLGLRALTAIERLMGMLLVAISVQMLLDGLVGFLRGAGAG